MEILIGFLTGIFILPVLHFLNITLGFFIRFILKKRLRLKCKGYLALTYDDGPSDLFQTKLLTILSKYNAKATFFLLGIRAEGRSNQIEDLEKYGHEIENHSFAHLNAIYAGPVSIYRDFKYSMSAFKGLHLRPRLYRPPYGKITFTSWLQVYRNNYTYVFWTHDSADGMSNMKKTSASICDDIDRNGGGVILFHSNNSNSERENFILQATEDLLELANKKNLKIVCISEIFK